MASLTERVTTTLISPDGRQFRDDSYGRHRYKRHLSFLKTVNSPSPKAHAKQGAPKSAASIQSAPVPRELFQQHEDPIARQHDSNNNPIAREHDSNDDLIAREHDSNDDPIAQQHDSTDDPIAQLTAEMQELRRQLHLRDQHIDDLQMQLHQQHEERPTPAPPPDAVDIIEDAEDPPDLKTVLDHIATELNLNLTDPHIVKDKTATSSSIHTPYDLYTDTIKKYETLTEPLSQFTGPSLRSAITRFETAFRSRKNNSETSQQLISIMAAADISEVARMKISEAIITALSISQDRRSAAADKICSTGITPSPTKLLPYHQLPGVIELRHSRGTNPIAYLQTWKSIKLVALAPLYVELGTDAAAADAEHKWEQVTGTHDTTPDQMLLDEENTWQD